jgi:hypothetical protein
MIINEIIRSELYRVISYILFAGLIIGNIVSMALCGIPGSGAYYISIVVTFLAICYFVIISYGIFYRKHNSNDSIYGITYVFFAVVGFIVAMWTLIAYSGDCMEYANYSWSVMSIVIFPILPLIIILLGFICFPFYACFECISEQIKSCCKKETNHQNGYHNIGAPKETQLDRMLY